MAYTPRHQAGQPLAVPAFAPNFTRGYERHQWIKRHGPWRLYRRLVTDWLTSLVVPIETGGGVHHNDVGNEAVMEWTSSPVSGYPFSMGTWATFDTTLNRHSLMEAWAGTGGPHRQWLYVDDANDKTNVFVEGPTTFENVVSATSTIDATNWFHIAGAFTSATARAAYFNGGEKGTGTTNVGTPNTLDNFSLFTRGNDNGFTHDGQMAEAVVYAKTLADEQFAGLGAGSHPLLIDDPAFYLPLFNRGDDSYIDWFGLGGATTVTTTNLTNGVSHAPVAGRGSLPGVGYPPSLQTIRPSSTVSAGNWTAVGAASLHAATNDDSDASYANLNEGDDPSAMDLGLDTLQRPGSGTGTITIRERHA